MASLLRVEGILHRDVKPDNICLRFCEGRPLTSPNPLVLIDFGRAILVGDQDKEGGMDYTVVAPNYRAPEL